MVGSCMEEFDDGYTCNFFCLSVFFVFLPSSCLLVLSLARCLWGSWACNCLEAAPIPRWVFEAASLPFLHQLRLQCVFLGQKLFWRIGFLKFFIFKDFDGFSRLPGSRLLHQLRLHNVFLDQKLFWRIAIFKFIIFIKIVWKPTQIGFRVYHASGSTIWHCITRFGVFFWKVTLFQMILFKILTDEFSQLPHQLRVHHIVPVYISNNCLKVLRWVSRLVQTAPGSTLLHIGWFPNLLDAFPSQIRLVCFFNQKWDMIQNQFAGCSAEA